MQEIGFDAYVDEIGKPGVGIFVLLLEDEYAYLGAQDSHWLNHTNERTFVVRLSVDDFKILDYGVHPMFQFYLNGKEFRSLRGVISLDTFSKVLKDINHERRRKPSGR